jgi:ribosomal protein S27E
MPDNGRYEPDLPKGKLAIENQRLLADVSICEMCDGSENTFILDPPLYDDNDEKNPVFRHVEVRCACGWCVNHLVTPLSGLGRLIMELSDEPEEEVPASQSQQPYDQEKEDIAELCICESCDSELVYPVEWEEHGKVDWEVTLRCPNCEHTETNIYDQTTVERFDEQLDRGTESVARDLKRLAHSNMEDEIDRFADALEEGHVLPEDF